MDRRSSSKNMDALGTFWLWRHGHAWYFNLQSGLPPEVGNGNLTLAEQRTHFNLWALSKSPLLIGTHVPAHQSFE